MSSTTPFACGEEDAPAPAPAPARVVRRATGGLPPPPPFARHGWQGGKPPPGSLRRDIAARAAPAAEQVGDYSDDEDFMRGPAIAKRQKAEEKKHKPEIEPEVYHESEEEEEDESDGEWYAHPPPPLVTSATQAPPASSSSSSSSSAPQAPAAPPANATELMMKCAVEQAFKSGIEEGKKMQLPQQCKTCAVRKERNRIAAKESRHKKRLSADFIATRMLWTRAADEAARRGPAPVLTTLAAPAPAATVATSARAAAGGGDEELVPPPF